MAVTPARLQAAHPEFAVAADALVQSMIDYAALEVAEDVYGASYDRAVTLYACHLLALTPDGRPMRLDPTGSAGHYGLALSVYGALYERLKTASACGLGRVV